MPHPKRVSSSSSSGSARSRGGGFAPPLVLLLFLFVLAPFLFLVVKNGVRARVSPDQRGSADSAGKQVLDWREQPAVQELKSVLTKELIDSIAAGQDELEPWSLDSFRKNHISSSWQIEGLNGANVDADQNNGTLPEHQMLHPRM